MIDAHEIQIQEAEKKIKEVYDEKEKIWTKKKDTTPNNFKVLIKEIDKRLVCAETVMIELKKQFSNICVHQMEDRNVYLGRLNGLKEEKRKYHCGDCVHNQCKWCTEKTLKECSNCKDYW